MPWHKIKPRRPLRSPSPASSPSSSVIETTRSICVLVSNLGSGALNVPGLQAAGLIGCQIIDIIQKMKDNQDACNDLVDDIGQLMSPINLRLQACNVADIDDELRADIKRLEEGLQKVRETLQFEAERSRLDRAFNSGRNAGEIAKCKAIVNRQFVSFQNSSLMSLRMSVAGLKRPADGPKTGEQDANDQVAQSAGPSPSQPLAPDIWFGRGDILSSLVAIITGNKNPRIAILGAGGMGKTATALHLIRNEAVVARYGDRAFFVACDAATSTHLLASRILQIMGVAVAAEDNLVTAMYLALKSAPPTLLLLDNFESIWESGGDHAATRDLLQKIADCPSSTLIITMRATTPPPGIRWTISESLPPLPAPSAKEVFFAINATFCDNSDDGNEVLDELLRELDYVPLAIHLLAHVSMDFTPRFVLKQWQKQRTRMLSLNNYTHDKLESADVSISLSIASLNVKQNPGSIQLLGMLCLLPDGLLQWQERLEVIEETFETVTFDLRLLRKIALVYTAGGKLAVLSPIRHFVLQHYPPDAQHAQCIYNIFWELVNTYTPVRFGPKFKGAVDALSPELGNIGSLIHHAVSHNVPMETIVEIAIKVSWHLYRTHPSHHLLRNVSTLVPSVHAKTQAKYLHVTGVLLYRQSDYLEAASTFRQARGLFLEIEDRLGAAQCSQRLGDTLTMQGKHAEAADILTDARSQLVEIGHCAGAAHCSRSLGNILRMQSNYSEATDILTDARAQFHKIGDRLGATQCSQSLGDTLRMQGNYSEAAAILTDTRAEFLEIGERLGAAQCSRSLGDVLGMQGNYSDATAILTDARAQFLQLNDRMGEAQCSQLLGEILLAQRKYTEAANLLTHARDRFADIGHKYHAAYCAELLAKCTHARDEATSVAPEVEYLVTAR